MHCLPNDRLSGTWNWKAELTSRIGSNITARTTRFPAYVPLLATVSFRKNRIWNKSKHISGVSWPVQSTVRCWCLLPRHSHPNNTRQYTGFLENHITTHTRLLVKAPGSFSSDLKLCHSSPRCVLVSRWLSETPVLGLHIFIPLKLNSATAGIPNVMFSGSPSLCWILILLPSSSLKAFSPSLKPAS